LRKVRDVTDKKSIIPIKGIKKKQTNLNKPKQKQTNIGGITLPKVEGDIEFDNVSFFYPSRPNVPVLHGL